MATDIVEALTTELAAHGATNVRYEHGGKHPRLCWTHDGQPMFHIISLTPNNADMHKILALRDVRRMIGVNQGSGPGERRRRGPPRRATQTIAPPPECITVRPDPMAPLLSLQGETNMGQPATATTTSARTTARAAPAKKPPVTVTPTAREREWLEEMLKHGEKGRHIVAKRRVTPGLAAAMMELNLGNRPFTEAQVKLHEDRLRRGDFVLTHQGLSFARTRVLNDGQHRLTAIMNTGIAGDLMITFGAEREEFKVIDGGRPRKAADLVGIMLNDAPTLRATVARLVLLAETRSNQIDHVLVAERAVMMQSEPETEIALRLGWAMKKVSSASHVAAAYYWIAKHSPNKARINAFFDEMPSGKNLVGPKLKLREWLRDKTAPGTKTTGGRNLWRMHGIIVAWNAWVTGRATVSFAKLPTGPTLPEVE